MVAVGVRTSIHAVNNLLLIELLGPGLPEHEHQRIFERFVRLDTTKPGLGLAISHRIAQQDYGDLTCDPKPSGASFTLRLPTKP